MRRRISGLLLAMVLGFAPAAFAQTVAELSGRVTDATGGALPGVAVTATQTATGFTRQVVTSDRGEYVFTNLPVGPYRLAARLDGFTAFEQTGIVLAVGESRAVNISLAIGSMSETVSVQADASLVESRDVGVGRLVEADQIVGLPLDGRSVTQLVILAGNAVEIGGTSGNRAYPGAAGISVAGGTSNSTNYLVDGGYNNDPQQNSGNAMPFPDALQEFNVETGVRSARYGQSTGATVNAVTRSGTNDFHGGMFEFARHHAFNAIQYFDREENGGLGRDDGLKRFQTGGTLGGPIMRDKLFFFGGVQITNTRIAPVSTDQIVPTAEVRAGDFRRILSATCRGGTARTLSFPFVDNQVNPNLFHPISLQIMNLLPLPDPALDPDGCGRYVAAIPNDSDEQQYIGRVDYNMGANHRTFARVFYSRYYHAPLFDINTNPNLIFASGNGLGNDAVMKTFAGGWDWVMSQNLFSSMRVSFQRTDTARVQGNGLPTYRELGMNTFQYTTKPGQHFMRNGNAGWDANGLTGTFAVTTPSISQDFDWIKGSHSLSFGGSWTRPHANGDGTFQSNGQLGYSGIFTSGTANANGGLNMADFVLGLPETFRQGGSQLNNQILNTIGLYVQDVWRVSSRLTLNYGVRWEPFITAVDQNGFNSAFVRERFDQGLRSTAYPNAPIGMVFPGDAGFEYLAEGKNSRDQWNKWAPRFGLVWDPRGDTQQTIRAGVGHYYDAPKLWTSAHHVLGAPYGLTADAVRPNTCPPPNHNGCALTLEDPWRHTPGGDPLSGRLARQGEAPLPIPQNVTFPLNAHYASNPPDTQNMEVTQWNVAYERQLPGRMMVDVTYIGSRTQHIWVGYEENPAVYIPGTCAPGTFPGVTAANPNCSNTNNNNVAARSILRLLNPVEGAFYTQGDIDQLYPDATGHYNSIRVGIQKRMSNGWSMNANYTRSKCINQGEPAVDINNVFPVAQRDPFNDPKPDASTNEGPCDADRPHLFNLSSVVVSPGFGSGILHMVTRDWQAGVIYQARSGAPLTPTTTGNLGLIGGIQRPFIVPGVDPKLDEPVWVPNGAGVNTRLRYFDIANAFRPNGPGEWGDTPKGYLRGPGFWNVNLSFSRNINLAQGRRVELRVEAFNLFDTVNWGNPNVQLANANAGMITTTSGDPRIMQFAVKYNF